MLPSMSKYSDQQGKAVQHTIKHRVKCNRTSNARRCIPLVEQIYQIVSSLAILFLHQIKNDLLYRFKAGLQVSAPLNTLPTLLCTSNVLLCQFIPQKSFWTPTQADFPNGMLCIQRPVCTQVLKNGTIDQYQDLLSLRKECSVTIMESEKITYNQSQIISTKGANYSCTCTDGNIL